MTFGWLKRFMPRGLYGRAALILLLPIITLQVVLSLVFIQRHFEDVTRQMTRTLALDLQMLQGEINAAETLQEAQATLSRLTRPLEFGAQLPSETAPASDRRVFYDLSGRIVIQTLQDRFAPVMGVDLTTNRRQVSLGMETRYGVAKIWLNRRQVSASNPHQFLVLMVSAGLIMTVVALIFLRNQLRPIRRLARAAEAFGRGRVEEYRPAGAAEVRSAGTAFLDMRARIERHIEQRTLMLSGVSHDLRTPLTRFKLGLSLIEKQVDISDLERDVADMDRLLDAFLAFAQDNATEEPEEVDPIALVHRVVKKYSDAGKAVEFIQAVDSGLAVLRPSAIVRVLENLIGNGLRYGTDVRVSVAVTPKTVIISVEDDGPGIPKDLRADATKPFVRLDAARNQDTGSGVGLGLAIAHDIARQHGGTLRLGQSQILGGLQADFVVPR